MKNLPLKFACLFFSLCGFSTVVQAQMALSKVDRQLIISKADSLLDQAMLFKEFAGVSAGVFYQGEVVWANGAGYRDIENKKPATADMLHRIASITKPMTAVAIMQLVEEKQIDLDATIQTYLPNYPRHKEGDITIRHLLNHTSGIKAYPNQKEGFSKVQYASLEEAMTLFKDRPLNHVPGKKHLYTTYGYTVLGVILEKVTGQKYEEYMQENVWTPAGMNSTGLEIFGKKYPNQSKLYQRTKKGQIIADKLTNLSVKYPGGGLLSTVPDLLHFGQAILENKLIPASALETMRQAPDVEWKGTRYGLGWFLFNDDTYGRIVRHGGRQSGTNTYLSIFLDQGLTVAVIANDYHAGGAVGNLHRELYQLTLDADKRRQPLRKEVKLSKAAIKTFLGKYEFGSGQIITISLDGDQLNTKVGKYPKLPIYAEAENKFFYRAFDAQFEFVLNDKNEVVKTIYTQNGKSSEPKKVQ